jgi:hypothetical protein
LIAHTAQATIRRSSIDWLTVSVERETFVEAAPGQYSTTGTFDGVAMLYMSARGYPEFRVWGIALRTRYAPQTKSLTPDTPRAGSDEILDQFVRQGRSRRGARRGGARFKKAIIERALGGELTHHLGYPPGGDKPDDTTNHRNGTGGKTVLTDDGPLRIEVPRESRRDIRTAVDRQTRTALHRLRRQDSGACTRAG